MDNDDVAGDVVVDLASTRFSVRHACDICGMMTPRLNVMAVVRSGRYRGYKVCPHCLQTRDFDAGLAFRARVLESMAADLRALVGRIVAPSYEAYRAAADLSRGPIAVSSFGVASDGSIEEVPGGG